MRKLGLGIVIGSLTMVAGPANAYNSGRNTSANVSGTFFWFGAYQSATETLTYTTSNLSSGADTVIHVQNGDDPQYGFVAGNDDITVGNLASQVTIPPVGYGRALIVLVRSYSQWSAGSCDLTTTSSLYGSSTQSITFAGAVTIVGDLQQGAHVSTAELQGGATDTVMLTVTSSPGHAVALDDDDGTGRMSFVHNDEACNFCAVVLANYSDAGTSNATLVWDDDADWSDYDSDGIGATLEGVLGTCPGPSSCTCPGPGFCLPPEDSDNDGLSDGAELLGTEVDYVPIKLSTWGADPLQKDMFLEMDWQKCVEISDPNKCPTGDANSGQMGAGLPDADFQTYIVEPIKTDFGAANVRVHFDAGRANSNSSIWYDWGDWGGAALLDAGSGCGDAGNTPERAFLFHHGISYPPEANVNGNDCWLPSPFFNTYVNSPRTIVHETGHDLGLQHGGRPNKISINYKPQYVSIMNYVYQWDAPSFSHGDAPVPSLNPTAVAEQPGLGSLWSDTNVRTLVLTKLRDGWCPVTAYSSGKCVNIDGNAGAGIPIGAVDWNRDGSYAATGTTVQGPVTEWDFSWKARSAWYGSAKLKDPAMTWVSVGGSVGNQLWIFGRDDQNRFIWARTPATTLNSGCGSFSSFYDEANYDCAGFGGEPAGATTLISGTNVLTVAPGAAEYNAQILIVFQRDTIGETIRANLITINSSTGSISYGTEVALPGGYVAAGDITALKTASGQVTVWAPVNTPQRKLMEWRYASGSWAGGQTADIQKWSEDSTDINPIWGIGATRGYQDGSSTEQTYGAIPTNPSGLVEFARKNAGTNTWTKVTYTCTAGSFGCVSGTASSWAGLGGVGVAPSGTQPMAAARPGLAYQKTAGQANTVGRFYMAINQSSSCSGPFGAPNNDDGAGPGCSSRLIMTEGNLASGTPATRRLTWITPAHWLTNKFAVGGISLVDDLTRDTNLRAAFADPGGTGLFEPLADGIVNASLSDMDDFPYVSGALRAALCMDGGTWPDQCSLPPHLP